MVRGVVWGAAVVLLASTVHPVAYRQGEGDTASAIRAIVRDHRDLTRDPLTAAELGDLTRLYEAANYAALWVDTSGRPTRDAADAIRLFTSAGDEGMDPLDYNAGVLGESLARLSGAARTGVSDAAWFDARMSANTLRYLRHMHLGRIDPRTIGLRMPMRTDEHDFADVLRGALGAHRVSQAAAEFAPPLVLYRALRTMLARYRSLAAGETSVLVFPAATIKPGQPFEGGTALHRRLVALGDLPAGAPIGDGTLYEGALVEGVKRFQVRHQLEADGVLGRSTQAALSVPLSRRARQIELALERLRWLPDLDADRFLAVNIPMFRLWGWEAVPPDGAPAFGTNVIVGKALNTQTPVFVEQMEHVIFRPYWNVPRSILRSEILPALRRDPRYLDRHDFEIVAGQTDDATPVALSARAIEQLESGALRVRQRPGPNNALGLVKFVFPNDENVYMHSTPAKELFSRSRRDFSHGCVRVADATALAAWALRGQSEWTADRIEAAMNGTRPLRVNLARPIQVILFYVTAVVMPEDGSVRFAEDIYRHDTRLDQAMSRHPPVR